MVFARPKPTAKAKTAAAVRTRGQLSSVGLSRTTSRKPVSPERSISEFTLGRALGRGKFGNVYSGTEISSGIACAIKVLLKAQLENADCVFQLQREVAIHARLQHPNILRLLACFQDPKKVYLVLEFAPGGEVFKALQSAGGRFEPPHAAQHVAAACDALIYCHERHVYHRDIKPENMLYASDGRPMLADFGWAVHAPRPAHLRGTICGTPEYLAPEIVACRKYSSKVDIWAVGVLAFELLYGRTPFVGASDDDTYANIVEGDLHFPDSADVPIAAQDFIRKALQQHPRDRPTAEALRQHPWIRRIPQSTWPTDVATAGPAAPVVRTTAASPDAMLSPAEALPCPSPPHRAQGTASHTSAAVAPSAAASSTTPRRVSSKACRTPLSARSRAHHGASTAACTSARSCPQGNEEDDGDEGVGGDSDAEFEAFDSNAQAARRHLRGGQRNSVGSDGGTKENTTTSRHTSFGSVSSQVGSGGQRHGPKRGGVGSDAASAASNATAPAAASTVDPKSLVRRLAFVRSSSNHSVESSSVFTPSSSTTATTTAAAADNTRPTRCNDTMASSSVPAQPRSAWTTPPSSDTGDHRCDSPASTPSACVSSSLLPTPSRRKSTRLLGGARRLSRPPVRAAVPTDSTHSSETGSSMAPAGTANESPVSGGAGADHPTKRSSVSAMMAALSRAGTVRTAPTGNVATAGASSGLGNATTNERRSKLGGTAGRLKGGCQRVLGEIDLNEVS